MISIRQRVFEYGFWLVGLPLAWLLVAWNRAEQWSRFGMEVDWSRYVTEEVTSCLAALVMVRFVVWWLKVFPLQPPWWPVAARHLLGSLLFALGHFALYIVQRALVFPFVEGRDYAWMGGAVANFFFEYQKDVGLYVLLVLVVWSYGRYIRPVWFPSRASPSTEPISDRVMVMTGRGQRVLPLGDILYLQAARNYVSYHTRDGEFVARETLSGLEERLAGQPFARSHRSYLVNLRHVRELRENEVVLADGRTVPLSRQHRASFQSALLGA